MSLTTNYTKLNLDTIYSNTGGLIDPLTRRLQRRRRPWNGVAPGC